MIYFRAYQNIHLTTRKNQGIINYQIETVRQSSSTNGVKCLQSEMLPERQVFL